MKSISVTLLPIAAMIAVASASAQQPDTSVVVDKDSAEYKFAACINDRDQSLLYAMRDAPSMEAMQQAAEKAFALCPEEGAAGQFSMKKFFDSVASFIGKPTYDDEPEGENTEASE